MVNPNPLPITRPLTLAYVLSLITAVLLAAASLAGLLFPSALYHTGELRNAFIPTDVVNLLIGLPILLGLMALAHRGKLIGLLFWPGALLFVAYHAIAFAMGTRGNWQLMPYLVLVALSVCATWVVLRAVDAAAVRHTLQGGVPERLAGGVLAGMGILFLGLVAQSLSAQVVSAPEMATAVADLTLIPALVIGGVLLWRRQAFGYMVGAGLLFVASMLFVGLLVYFILQPFLTGVTFPLQDFVVVLAMGLVCFVPFGLFVRGIAIRSGSDSAIE